jgi:hypothetical protein
MTTLMFASLPSRQQLRNLKQQQQHACTLHHMHHLCMGCQMWLTWLVPVCFHCWFSIGCFQKASSCLRRTPCRSSRSFTSKHTPCISAGLSRLVLQLSCCYLSVLIKLCHPALLAVVDAVKEASPLSLQSKPCVSSASKTASHRYLCCAC